MTLVSARRVGFSVSSLHNKKEPHALHFISQRVTFWVAVVSVFAFVTGNMIGQHGFYAFFHSVLGDYDDSLLVYSGTVDPVAQIPDPTKWSYYGGDASVHTFREAPQNVLGPLWTFKPLTSGDRTERLEYSTDYYGTYATGNGDGSHAGIDIRMPIGTPVQSIANGIIVKVAEDPSGFGKYILEDIKGPDPAHPGTLIRLYVVYAHLSTTLISEGMTVQKGEEIALSGMSGDATGPHLHFAIQRDVCTDDGTVIGPHTFWPFNAADLRAAGMTYEQGIDKGLNRAHGMACMVNPMLYVQAHYAAPANIAKASASSSSRQGLTAAQLRAQRLAARLALLSAKSSAASSSVSSVTTVALAPASSSASSSLPPSVVSQETVAYAPPPSLSQTVSSMETRLIKDDSGSRIVWTMRITLLDADGKTVLSPNLPRDIAIRTTFGKATFSPDILTPLDFNSEGEARVQVYPSSPTVVAVLQPYNIQGTPMRFGN